MEQGEKLKSGGGDDTINNENDSEKPVKLPEYNYSTEEEFFLTEDQILEKFRTISSDIAKVVPRIEEKLRALANSEQVDSAEISELFSQASMLINSLDLLGIKYKNLLYVDRVADLTKGQKIFMVIMMVLRGSFERVWLDRFRKGANYNKNIEEKVSEFVELIKKIKDDYKETEKKYKDFSDIPSYKEKETSRIKKDLEASFEQREETIREKEEKLQQREKELQESKDLFGKKIGELITPQEKNLIKSLLISFYDSFNHVISDDQIYYTRLPFIAKEQIETANKLQKKLGITFMFRQGKDYKGFVKSSTIKGVVKVLEDTLKKADE